MTVQRREFITLLGGAAAAWPLAAGAQQSAMPVVGLLDIGGGQPRSYVAFRKGMREMGYVEGRNLAIEYLSTAQYNQSRSLTAELVRRGVTVIFTDTANATQAGKAATTTIPIVFAFGPDPVRLGVVVSLNRPGGNATGLTTLSAEMVAKRLELLRELVPQATLLGFPTNRSNLMSEGDTAEIQAAARSIGQQMVILRARTADEIDAAFATLLRERAGGLLVDGDGLLFNQRAAQFAVLAARAGIPQIYTSPAQWLALP
jgi:putative ABC transport system substrate-binding protein